MDWFRVDSGLPQHHKLGRLARTLRARREQVGWSLVCLWAFAARNRESGDLSGLDPDELAEVSAWDGDAEAWSAALVKCKLIDENPDGTRILHGWTERQPLLKRRDWASNRERKSNPVRARKDHVESTQRAPCVEPQTDRQTDRQEKLTSFASQPPRGGEKITRSAARHRFHELDDVLARLRRVDLLGAGPERQQEIASAITAALAEQEQVRLLAFPESGLASSARNQS